MIVVGLFEDLLVSNIYRLKIVVDGVSPAVWRDVEVPSNLSLESLHFVICNLMDWDSEPPYAFEMDEDVEITEASSPVTAYECVLSDFIKRNGQSFLYSYFYNSYRLAILVESIMPEKNESKKIICLSGARRGPSDKCDFTVYTELVEIMQKKKATNYEKFRVLDIIGKKFDPEKFDMEKINLYLKMLCDNCFSNSE